MRLTPLIAALAACLGASRAEAHAFEAGADYYAQFVEGASVVLTYPELLLPVLALGILLTLWDMDGLPRVWSVYIAGLVVGIFGAALVGPWMAVVLLAFGVVVAALGAVLPRHTRAEALGLAGLAGLFVMAGSLEGHGLFELGLFIHLGLFFGANIALALSAGLVRLAFVQSDAGWIRIGARIAASWIGAVLVLILAFTVRGG